MHCWICGDPADTGEHMIKVTDLEALFGHTTTHKPLYRRIDSGPQELVQGKNSPKLKFRTRLCSYCNNTRTQSDDRSWQALATHLRSRDPKITPSQTIRVAKAFQAGVRPGLLGVHLYFLKLFGCLILDAQAPIDTNSFATSILNRQAHPDVYLCFLAVTSKSFHNQAVVTPVHTIEINGSFSGAQWFYFTGRIGVHITLSPQIHLRSNKVHLWHPRFTSKTLTLDGM